ncbi:hypothetical protein QVD99_006965 [Batrachochytrium dendrobatidis]|nr:hypothetical protein O5D80_007802 [Batrachochytrium dendrobatidis]KAK5666192.1 hypothetical protein QVD99_006965 [Batrachochytrium dendrobatidis]
MSQFPKSSVGKLIYVSPNESIRLEAEEKTRLRLERICQVRTQEKKLAAERRNNFKQQSGQEWSNVVEKLHVKWSDDKEKEENHLHELMDKMSKRIGEAHLDASFKSLDKRKCSQQLLESIAQSQQTEIVRSRVAASHQRRQHYDRIEPILLRNAILHSVQQQESFRARLVANQYREQKRSSFPIVEIVSKPLAQTHYRSLQHRPQNYDNSSLHREYAVVRCQQPHHPAQNSKNAKAVAVIEHQARAQQLYARREVLQTLDQNARVRHERAIVGIQLNKKRDKVLSELDRLDMDDRQRKQVNAGLYSAKFRPDHIRVGSEQLHAQFGTQFNMDKDYGTALQTTGYARSSHRKLDQRSNTSYSIELTKKAGDELDVICTKPRRSTTINSDHYTAETLDNKI